MFVTSISQLRAAMGVVALLVLIAGWVFSPALVLGAAVGLALVALILRVPVAGFVLLAFAVPWGGGLAASATIGPTELIVAVLGAAWLAAAALRRENPFAGAPWTPYVLLFLAAILLSMTQAADLTASAKEVIKWAELAAMYWSGTYFLRNRRDLLLVLWALITAGVSQALYGSYQTVLSVGPAAFAAERALLRAYGSFDQPNPFAGYLNMIWPFALALAIRGPRAGRKWAWASAIVIGFGVLASESRGALLAGIFALIVMLALTSRGGNLLARVAALALLAGGWLISFGISLGPMQRALDALGLTGISFQGVTNADFSAVERAAHWLAGVRMFAAHPFLGVGIGNYSDAYPAYHPRGWYDPLGHAHDYYINIAAEAGIVGLTSYVLLLGAAFWYAGVAFRLARARVSRAVALGLVGALAATGFHNIFDVLYVHGTTALIGLMMALTSVVFRRTPLAPAATEAAPAAVR